MLDNGKIKDVIITLQERELYGRDYLEVFADRGLFFAFQKIDGVLDVRVKNSVQYIIDIDPRYDTDFIIKEVEAIAKIGHTPNTKAGIPAPIQGSDIKDLSSLLETDRAQT